MRVVALPLAAAFAASGSFFLGQADSLAESLRVRPAPTTLAFLPLLLMCVRLWRYRDRRRSVVAAPAPWRCAGRRTGQPLAP